MYSYAVLIMLAQPFCSLQCDVQRHLFFLFLLVFGGGNRFGAMAIDEASIFRSGLFPVSFVTPWKHSIVILVAGRVRCRNSVVRPFVSLSESYDTCSPLCNIQTSFSGLSLLLSQRCNEIVFLKVYLNVYDSILVPRIGLSRALCSVILIHIPNYTVAGYSINSRSVSEYDAVSAASTVQGSIRVGGDGGAASSQCISISHPKFHRKYP